jgi:flagellar hook-basal body complex protein FliE
MDVRLKPFDFAQAVARAGLRTDGMPLSTPKVAPAAEPGASF